MQSRLTCTSPVRSDVFPPISLSEQTLKSETDYSPRNSDNAPRLIGFTKDWKKTILNSPLPAPQGHSFAGVFSFMDTVDLVCTVDR
ncbi:hypothetical protein DPMN_042001 [Dreissena polymorpha]|uniref:Uncharacterized protein n=1 Tax=Dreissena polymorpha TaxID=45954 RepID=A0A9D4D0B4_DREPO|nr:hypothetical protein DPMN_042001 [Dreissena polymorpha]